MSGDCAEGDAALLGVARAVMAISLRAAETVPGGVSAVQLRALTVLSTVDQVNLADLGTALGMSPSSASRLCDRLVSRGLVDRQVSPRTRREVALSLSTEGRALLTAYDRERLTALRAALAGLAPRRQQEVLAALRDFVTAAEDVTGAVSRTGI